MMIRGALSSVGSVVCLALSLGCSAEASDGAESGGGDAVNAAAEGFDYAPEAAAVAETKQAVQDDLDAKGSTSAKFGQTFFVPITIPVNGSVSCYTTGASDNVDPVLALFRRHDNQNKTTPYSEHAWLQTLAINDDDGYNGRNSYFNFSNTSGSVLNAYLMAFAWSDKVGQVGLWCSGGPSQTVTLAAGSAHVYASSGFAATSNSYLTSGAGGDPWLFMLDEQPLSYNSDWNDDYNGLESGFNYQGPNRLVWFIAHSGNSGSGTTTINW
jgi:hypothetical protein